MVLAVGMNPALVNNCSCEFTSQLWKATRKRCPVYYFIAICDCSGRMGSKAIGRESPQSLRDVTQADDITRNWNFTRLVKLRADVPFNVYLFWVIGRRNGGANSIQKIAGSTSQETKTRLLLLDSKHKKVLDIGDTIRLMRWLISMKYKWGIRRVKLVPCFYFLLKVPLQSSFDCCESVPSCLFYDYTVFSQNLRTCVLF